MAKKNKHAVALGKLGGKKGGTQRAKNLTPAERSAIARLGGLKRWPKKKPDSKLAPDGCEKGPSRGRT
jgi:hypothetical protein